MGVLQVIRLLLYRHLCLQATGVADVACVLIAQASFTSSEGGELVDEHGNKVKRRRFEAARKAHYNMKVRSAFASNGWRNY